MKKTFKHNDFTATFSDEGTGPNNRYFSLTGEIDGSSGAVGDQIVKIYPAFQILEDLHLAKLDGEPMHALENGFYHYKKAGGAGLDALQAYWHEKLTVTQRLAIHNCTNSQKKKIIASIMEEIRPLWAIKVAKARKLVASTPSDITEIDETVNLDDFDDAGKVRALAAWLDVHFSTITEDGDQYTAAGIEYQVWTDDEADEAEDREFDSYLEDCVFPDLPKNMVNYFDRDAWKKDAKIDGRGHSLGRYDGEENEITDPETNDMYFVYRC